MPRDNEKIISICADLNEAVRQGIRQLFEAGAPTDMIFELMNMTRCLEHAPQHLADRIEPIPGRNYPEIRSEILEVRSEGDEFRRVLEKLDRLLDKLDVSEKGGNDG